MTKYKFLITLIFFIFAHESNSQNTLPIEELEKELSILTSPEEQINTLIQITSFYAQNNNIDKLKDYLERLDGLSRKNNHQKGIYESYLLKARLDRIYKKDSLSLKNLNEAINVAKDLGDFFREGKAYYMKASFYNSKNNLSKTFEYNLKAESTFDKTDSLFYLKIKNLNHIVLFNIQMENYESALNYLTKITNLTEGTSFVTQETYAYSYIGAVYSEMNNHTKAIEYLKKAVSKFKSNSNYEGEITVTLNLGIGYYNNKEYDKAEKQLVELVSSPYWSEHNNNNTHINIRIEAQLYLGKIAHKKKKNKLSLTYLSAAKEQAEETESYDLYYNSLLEIAKVHHVNNLHKKALTYLEELAVLENRVFSPKELRKAYLLKSQIYNSLNNKEKEFQAYKKYINLKEQYQNKNNLNNIEFLKHSFEQKIKNKEIADQKKIIETLQEKDRIKTNNYILFSTLLILIIGFSIVSYFRLKKIKELRQEQLNFEIKSKQKQLTDFAIHITEKNDLLEKIKKQIVDANIENHNNEAVKNLLFFINEDIHKNKEKSQLYTNIEHNNDSFFDTLTNKYPNLSEKEKHVASLIRLGHSSKQISLQMNIINTSVNNYRYNLRKKLNLSRDENLTSFIKDI